MNAVAKKPNDTSLNNRSNSTSKGLAIQTSTQKPTSFRQQSQNASPINKARTTKYSGVTPPKIPKSKVDSASEKASLSDISKDQISLTQNDQKNQLAWLEQQLEAAKKQIRMLN